MATNNQVNVGLSGANGTGNFAGSTSATFVTPTLGAATGTSISFTATNGIIGVTGASNAAAGYVGEFASQSVLVGSAVSLTSGVGSNIASLSLTAGDWDVYGSLFFSPGAGTTSPSLTMGIGIVSATRPTAGSDNNNSIAQLTFAANSWMSLHAGRARFSLSGTTTVYMSADPTFAVSTMDAYGFLSARRIR